MTTRLAITLGDPRGVGPEIVGKALQDHRVASLIEQGDLLPILVGPRGAGLDLSESIGEWNARAHSDDSASGASSADFSDVAGSSGGAIRADFAAGRAGTLAAHVGTLAAHAGTLAGLAIERAVQLALAGSADGIVTAPIDKSALQAGGYDFPGHTEMLGALTGRATTMMLASDRLRVVLATTHIALREVPAAVTHEAIVQAAETTRLGLRTGFGISEPRLALCALNPHAGDHGRFGDEDDRILTPAAAACGIAGPFPADTVFVRAMRGEFDAVIAPYHDVGMTAIKVASFGSAVNITLGLPFPRTSPDHGTAMDIAGQGIASAESMVQAILMCRQLVLRLARSIPA